MRRTAWIISLLAASCFVTAFSAPDADEAGTALEIAEPPSQSSAAGGSFAPSNFQRLDGNQRSGGAVPDPGPWHRGGHSSSGGWSMETPSSGRAGTGQPLPKRGGEPAFWSTPGNNRYWDPPPGFREPSNEEKWPRNNPGEGEKGLTHEDWLRASPERDWRGDPWRGNPVVDDRFDYAADPPEQGQYETGVRPFEDWDDAPGNGGWNQAPVWRDGGERDSRWRNDDRRFSDERFGEPSPSWRGGGHEYETPWSRGYGEPEGRDFRDRDFRDRDFRGRDYGSEGYGYDSQGPGYRFGEERPDFRSRRAYRYESRFPEWRMDSAPYFSRWPVPTLDWMNGWNGWRYGEGRGFDDGRGRYPGSYRGDSAYDEGIGPGLWR